MMRLSVLTSFFNEAPNLPRLRERLEAVFAHLDVEPEIVLIDDHSTDESPAIARQWASADERVSYLRLSRNCGSHAAFSAGLEKCSGDCTVLLAADLQDPPETIPQLLAKWREGFQVVWATRGAEGRILDHEVVRPHLLLVDAATRSSRNARNRRRFFARRSQSD